MDSWMDQTRGGKTITQRPMSDHAERLVSDIAGTICGCSWTPRSDNNTRETSELRGVSESPAPASGLVTKRPEPGYAQRQW